MTTKPLYNALLALGYVLIVVSILRLGEYLGTPDTPDSFLVPIGMISLFVLSAAVMAYIFFYQPLVLMLEGKHADAAKLLGRTIAIFAGLTFAILSVVFLTLP